MSTELEIRQLQEAIVALRDELEKTQIAEREHIQHAVAAANEEVRQLRASIVELRETLERREAEHQDKMRDAALHYEREKAELQRTISKLRESLEDLNESLKKANDPSKTAAAPR